jgi:hypothetical protein
MIGISLFVNFTAQVRHRCSMQAAVECMGQVHQADYIPCSHCDFFPSLFRWGKDVVVLN